MEYRNLGESGLKISPIIAGCMTYGSKFWADWVIEDEDEIFRILKKAYDVGIRTFDTADVYSNGKSEILVGKFLTKYKIPRNRVVILTKLFFPVDDENPEFKFSTYKGQYPEYEYINAQGLSRKHIMEAAKRSTERLGTYADVIQIHRLDKTTPKKEIMKALNDIIDLGYTRYIGASSMKATEFAQLQFIAEQNGWVKFISMQNYYNLLYREEEREMIPFCQESDFGKVGVIPWSPIARGVLAKPLSARETDRKRIDSDLTYKALNLVDLSPADEEIIKRVEKVAHKVNQSMAVVATAWVLSKGAYPIVGLNSEKRVDDIIKSLELKLSEEDIKYLEEPYVPKNIVGHQ